jgi:hypothetical protein
VIRFGGFYGDAPVPRFDNVVNRFAILAALGKPVTVYGSGRQRRPVLSIDDASAALRFVLRAEGDWPDVVNVAEEIRRCSTSRTRSVAIGPIRRCISPKQDVLTHLSFEMRSQVLESRGWLAGRSPWSRGWAS